VDEATFDAAKANFDFVPTLDAAIAESGRVYELVRRTAPESAAAVNGHAIAETIDLAFPTESGEPPSMGQMRTRMPI
jgi:hypothetical protein